MTFSRFRDTLLTMKERRKDLYTETERAERETAGRTLREIAVQFSRMQWEMLRLIHSEVDKVEPVESESWSNRDSGLTVYASQYSAANINY